MVTTACVTGGTGFVATELIKQLLEKGATVHATVRKPDDIGNASIAALKALSAALPGTLKLFKADLLSAGDFDEAVQGCSVVYHTASPFGYFASEDPKRDLLDPALLGTQNVMSSVIKHKSSVRRVVLTSSVAAVHGEYEAPPKNGFLYTEEDWNETSSLENKQPYHLSKVIAEREAWKIAEAEGLDLVTILPNFIMGPLISRRADGVSIGFFKGVLEKALPTNSPVLCDVRDVAKAHILAAETLGAKGRYIVSHTSGTTPAQVSRILMDCFPDLDIPKLPEDAATGAEPDKIDNSRAAAELGLHLHPIESTLADMASTMIALGVAAPAAAAVKEI